MQVQVILSQLTYPTPQISLHPLGWKYFCLSDDVDSHYDDNREH